MMAQKIQETLYKERIQIVARKSSCQIQIHGWFHLIQLDQDFFEQNVCLFQLQNAILVGLWPYVEYLRVILQNNTP
jgi:hypothetical protein